MDFKMIIAFVEDSFTDEIIKAARAAGATGVTVINHARGEGVTVSKTFFGLTLETQRDVMIFLVETHLSEKVLNEIDRVGQFDEKPGVGIAFQIDVEKAIGVKHQEQMLAEKIGLPLDKDGNSEEK